VGWLKARRVPAESLLAPGNVIEVIVDQSKR
jgi:hypothetical protein